MGWEALEMGWEALGSFFVGRCYLLPWAEEGSELLGWWGRLLPARRGCFPAPGPEIWAAPGGFRGWAAAPWINFPPPCRLPDCHRRAASPALTPPRFGEGLGFWGGFVPLQSCPKCLNHFSQFSPRSDSTTSARSDGGGVRAPLPAPRGPPVGAGDPEEPQEVSPPPRLQPRFPLKIPLA